MNTTLEKTKATTNPYISLGLSVDVYLSDIEKIVIDIPLKEWQGGQYVVTGTEKFLLESISYSTSRKDEEFAIDHIRGRGFRRDKKLKVRDNWCYDLTQEVLDQIPVAYHDYAKKEFAECMEAMERDLQTIKSNGVLVKEKTIR
jgi:hypothetical protein